MSGADFCRYCGASIPHRDGEGRCKHCQHHATLFYMEKYRELREWAAGVGKCSCGYACPHDAAQRQLEATPTRRRTDDMGNWPNDWSCP